MGLVGIAGYIRCRGTGNSSNRRSREWFLRDDIASPGTQPWYLIMFTGGRRYNRMFITDGDRFYPAVNGKLWRRVDNRIPTVTVSYYKTVMWVLDAITRLNSSDVILARKAIQKWNSGNESQSGVQ